LFGLRERFAQARNVPVFLYKFVRQKNDFVSEVIVVPRLAREALDVRLIFPLPTFA
jgi:hypothetical protein